MNRRNLESTTILDYESPVVRRLADGIHPDGDSAIDFLRAAHGAISSHISAIYTVGERQPVSKTIASQRGSCSQRLACLEAIARSRGIGTRVRALWVAGKFWNSRFPLSRVFIPERILLAWPQFAVDERWCGVEDIYGAIEQRVESAPAPFTNDAETLFEAVRSTAVDFDGRTRMCHTACDLSRFVLESGETFDRRDDLFERLGSFEDSWKGKAFEWLYAGRQSA